MFACLFGSSFPAAGASEGCHGRLVEAARQCSPRVEAQAANLVTLDLDGLERLFGDLEAVGARIWQTANEAGCGPVQVAMAGTRTAAILLAVAHAGLTIVPADATAAALAALPLCALSVFAADAESREPARAGTGQRVPRRSRSQASVPGRTPIPDPGVLSVFARWGLRTLGQLAALPAGDLAARVGQAGLLWHRLARGEDACPLIPAVEDEAFEATHELEWPIDTLEPLSFVLGGLLDPLCQRLERRDRAAAVLSLHLRLVTREVHARSLQLPAPMREPKVLRTLLLLDLESHPAPAGIDAVTVVIDPTPGRIVQESLLERALPAPEQMSTLLARLDALMGERRCGSPQRVDSHRPGACAVVPFRVPEAARTVEALTVGGSRVAASGDRPESTSPRVSVPGSPRIPNPACLDEAARQRDRQSRESRIPVVALRRFRLPIPARVLIDDGHPASIRTERQGLQGGRVQAWAGPWRTSGEWWQTAMAGQVSELDRLRGRAGWDRDEWEVALSDGGIYRVFEDRENGRWFVEGIVD